MNEKKVIGIILAYKHASYLENLYRNLPKGVLDQVIITNDESGDNIEIIAQKLGLTCFSHPRLGYGGNLKYGLKKALELGADYSVEIHADGQFDVQVSEEAIKKAKEGYDFVTGNRFYDMRQPLRDKMPLIRYIANIVLSFLARITTGVHLSEFHNGFRVYSKELIESGILEKASNDFLFAFEVIALAKRKHMRIAQIPIRAFYTQEHSSISIPKAVEFAFQEVWSMIKYVLANFGIKLHPYE
jgi:glycosyltransferase involved in cell wall biosynthesis